MHPAIKDIVTKGNPVLVWGVGRVRCGPQFGGFEVDLGDGWVGSEFGIVHAKSAAVGEEHNCP